MGKLIPMIPLRDLVVFPHTYVPLLVGREKSLSALEKAVNSDKMIFLVAQKNPQTERPQPQDIYSIGTIATILQHQRLPDGNFKIVVEGKSRARITSYVDATLMFLVEVEPVEEIIPDEVSVRTLTRGIMNALEKLVNVNPKIPSDFLSAVAKVKDPAALADIVVSQLSAKAHEKQALLEEADVRIRLEKVYQILEEEVHSFEVGRKIRGKAGRGPQPPPGEAIQDEWREEIEQLEKVADEKELPEKVSDIVRKEIRKLKLMSPLAAEATVVRNYVDWLLSLPWTEKSEERLDLKEAKKILDEDHWGLEKPKERILECLAVRKLADKTKSPILCFVGPPGVGKTSLGKSIARATGRNFVRLSLGGIRDEAEIRGHRRTYIGALPGRIIQMMKKAETKNPVFLLDEVDKLCADFRGDPAAALLEVLDPEQNHVFLDHYLDIEFDLSDVLFICTANVTHTIPPALLDRMEVIHLPGYTDHEKVEIAKHFLIPKQEENNGLRKGMTEFKQDIIMKIIREYTREVGVRNLEREIGNIMRKLARKVVEKELDINDQNLKFKIASKDIQKYLGVPKFKDVGAESKELVGVARGLAWTETGGEVLMIEVAIVPGTGKLTITGKLGEVMQESAKAAISYVRMRSRDLGIDPEFYSKVDIHVHVPEGAVPKDGPSAGITIAVALVSALTRIPVKADITMTGEITLRGRVLVIGGIKQKLLAAHRYGVKNVVIPAENKKDLPDIPKNILKDLKIITVEHMDEVLVNTLAVSNPDELWKGRTIEKPLVA